MMDLITGMFTDLLSCNLSLFEELFTVVKNLYKDAILPMGIAILLLILIWQLFKTMFGRGGVAAEDPVELVCRSFLCFFNVALCQTGSKLYFGSGRYALSMGGRNGNRSEKLFRILNISRSGIGKSWN